MIVFKRWLKLSAAASDLNQLLRWIVRCKCSRFKRVVWVIGISVVINMIWRCRNEVYWNQLVPLIHKIVKEIKQIVKNRIQAVIPSRIARRDYNWFIAL